MVPYREPPHRRPDSGSQFFDPQNSPRAPICYLCPSGMAGLEHDTGTESIACAIRLGDDCHRSAPRPCQRGNPTVCPSPESAFFRYDFGCLRSNRRGFDCPVRAIISWNRTLLPVAPFGTGLFRTFRGLIRPSPPPGKGRQTGDAGTPVPAVFSTRE